MEGLKQFWSQYKGAIIGVIIAILILVTRLHDLILAIVVLFLGAFIGNYVQQNKDDVKKWMLDIQLGRRNLSPIQRIAIAEKYRPFYEKEAKENQSNSGGDKKSTEYKKSVTANLPQPIKDNKKRNPTTDKKLADIADVSEKTYRMGAKILNSDKEYIK